MGKLYDSIDGGLRSFIEAQHMFFVASAPSTGGHVNLSPKGLDTLRIIDSRTIVYLDYVGSGAETIAHLRDNGRIVLMLCAFDGSPKILRLHGRGDAIEPTHVEYAGLRRCLPGTFRHGRSFGCTWKEFPIRAATASLSMSFRATAASSRPGQNARAKMD